MHPHHHSLKNSKATKNVFFAFGLNVLLTFVEVAGAAWTGSVAIWANVIHDLGDSMTLGVALLLQKFSEKEADNRYTYGYARYSLLSALLAGIVLFLGSIMIFWHSIPLFWHHEMPKTEGMMGITVFGILINGIAFYRLSRGTTQNEKILSWHLFEDFAGWVSVLFGAVLMYFTKRTWIDPLLACLVASVVLVNAWKNLRQTFSLLLQGTPVDFDEVHFIQDLKKENGVCDVHDLHVWSLDGDLKVMSLHLVVDVNAPAEIERVKEHVRHTAGHFGRFHVTIEIEQSSEHCELRK